MEVFRAGGATETMVKDVFSRFGKVTNVQVKYEMFGDKKMSRGYGFVFFSEEDAAHRAVAENVVSFMGKGVVVKRTVF